MVQALWLDEVAVGERHVRPGVARPNGPNLCPLALGALDDIDQILQRARGDDLAGMATLVARVVSPRDAQASASLKRAAPRSASAAIVFDGLTPSAVRAMEPSSTYSPG